MQRALRDADRNNLEIIKDNAPRCSCGLCCSRASRSVGCYLLSFRESLSVSHSKVKQSKTAKTSKYVWFKETFLWSSNINILKHQTIFGLQTDPSALLLVKNVKKSKVTHLNTVLWNPVWCRVSLLHFPETS